jgi:hypothetical protein
MTGHPSSGAGEGIELPEFPFRLLVSMALPQRRDEVPFPHPGSSRDVPLLGLVVELLARAVLERSARLAAPSSSTRGLATHVPPNRGGEVGDRRCRCAVARAFLMFRLAAVVCFRVAISFTSVGSWPFASPRC